MELAINLLLLALFIRLAITSRDKTAEPTDRIVDAIFALIVVFTIWAGTN